MPVSRSLIVSLALSAALHSSASSQALEPAEQRRATFEAAWAIVDRAFFDPDHLGVDWAAVGDRYRARLSDIETDSALAELLTSMMSEIEASHLDLLTGIADSASEAYGEDGDSSSPLLEWAPYPGRRGIVVARVRSFDALSAQRVNDLMGDLAGSEAVILDLRGNEGGDISFLNLAARFMVQENRVGGLVTRAWLEATGHGFEDAVSLDSLPQMGPPYALDRLLGILQAHGAVAFVAGGITPAYEGCVAVLLDRHTGSAAEAFAMAMDRTTDAVLVGEPTAGALLSSEVFPLPNGWRLRVPVAVGLDEAGSIFWDERVEPDVRPVGGVEEAVEAAVQSMGRCAAAGVQDP